MSDQELIHLCDRISAMSEGVQEYKEKVTRLQGQALVLEMDLHQNQRVLDERKRQLSELLLELTVETGKRNGF